jgi:hypothetical protein
MNLILAYLMLLKNQGLSMLYINNVPKCVRGIFCIALGTLVNLLISMNNKLYADVR